MSVSIGQYKIDYLLPKALHQANYDLMMSFNLGLQYTKGELNDDGANVTCFMDINRAGVNYSTCIHTLHTCRHTKRILRVLGTSVNGQKSNLNTPS